MEIKQVKVMEMIIPIRNYFILLSRNKLIEQHTKLKGQLK